MITGDHIDTAKKVAKSVGIIRADELEHEGVALTGEEFRNEIGGYTKIWDAVH